MSVLSKLYTIEYMQWICDYIQMISIIIAIAFENMVGKVNEGLCVCWGCHWGLEG